MQSNVIHLSDVELDTLLYALSYTQASLSNRSLYGDRAVQQEVSDLEEEVRAQLYLNLNP